MLSSTTIIIIQNSCHLPYKIAIDTRISNYREINNRLRFMSVHSFCLKSPSLRDTEGFHSSAIQSKENQSNPKLADFVYAQPDSKYCPNAFKV